MSMILKNSVFCLKCNEEIISKNRHDYVKCKCGSSFTDGGSSYQRYGGSCVNTTVYDNGNHKLRRELITWGRNYDKDMNRLSETEWILIKDLEYSHIVAILKTQTQLSDFYKEVFETELYYRDLKEAAK